MAKAKPPELKELWPFVVGGDSIAIRLDAIVLNPEVQIRAAGTSPATVRDYLDAMKAGSKFPPVTAVQVDPSDISMGCHLVDGWHRTEAARRAGLQTVQAKVIQAELKELPWLAAQANMTHGLQLTRKDRRGCFRAYVKAGGHRTGRGSGVKSAKVMADDLKGIVSRHQLPVWMEKDFPSVFRAMKTGGLLDELKEFMPADESMVDRESEIAVRAAVDQIKARVRTIANTAVRERVVTMVASAAREIGGQMADVIVNNDF
ncbi:hypothetical protein [Rhizobium sp. RAF56]|uniref:hypothetical protein n=1 Tax=Rhizobium sp. RAF56 TaxID=3233062 RepID=UPI003F97E209